MQITRRLSPTAKYIYSRFPFQRPNASVTERAHCYSDSKEQNRSQDEKPGKDDSVEDKRSGADLQQESLISYIFQ